MADSKKRQADPSSGDPSPTQKFSGNLDEVSTLELLDRLLSGIKVSHQTAAEFGYLRQRIADLEEITDQARHALEKMDAAIEKLRAPALRVGTFLDVLERGQVLVSVGGTDYVCGLDPALPASSLQCGQRVLCNEAFVVVRSIGFENGGPVVRVEEILSDGRIRVQQSSGSTPWVVLRSALLVKEKLKPEMELRLDSLQKVALEVLRSSRRSDRSLEIGPEIPWSSVGGQDDAVRAIRDAIEIPYLHKDLFARFEHSVPKGFLLHGPPGCGKTLLGRAAASNLRARIREQTGTDRQEFFLHVKGPEILNMWVGESERKVRELFSQCREKALDGALSFLFIDEAESLLGTRHGGRFHNMSSTLVPMFCAEMDGLEPLQNVVVILASNRADLIDPAILRPGRVDRKIKVRRPDQSGAKRIFEIYLRASLPLTEPGEILADAVCRKMFESNESTRFLEVIYRSGRKDYLHRGDLASGAIIAAVVERAKGAAITRSIREGQVSFITREDLFASLDAEFSENELFPSGDLTEDWMKLTDLDPKNVVQLAPVRFRRADPAVGGVI